jgi:hypothetical protein
MAIADKFIKNLKVLLDKKAFAEEEINFILMTVQETATLSPVELISLLDNMDLLVEEAGKVMEDAEVAELKKELLED